MEAGISPTAYYIANCYKVVDFVFLVSIVFYIYSHFHVIFFQSGHDCTLY